MIDSQLISFFVMPELSATEMEEYQEEIEELIMMAEDLARSKDSTPNLEVTAYVGSHLLVMRRAGHEVNKK